MSVPHTKDGPNLPCDQEHEELWQIELLKCLLQLNGITGHLDPIFWSLGFYWLQSTGYLIIPIRKPSRHEVRKISNRTMFIVFAFSAYSVQFIIELISSCNSQRMIYQLEIYFKVSINTRNLTRKSYSPVNHEHATPSGLFLFY